MSQGSVMDTACDMQGTGLEHGITTWWQETECVWIFSAQDWLVRGLVREAGARGWNLSAYECI